MLTDLDSVDNNGKSCFPQRNSNQKSNNDTLKIWHPQKETLDELVDLPKTEHMTTSGGAPLYVAFQKPTQIDGNEVLSRTFEDALILANFDQEYFQKIPKLKTAKSAHDDGSTPLSKSLLKYVKGLNKGDFAFNCLFHLADKKSNRFNPPEYMSDGLEWLAAQLSPKV